MAAMMQVDIVSAEAKIFSGKAEMVLASGEMGELGIPFGHAQLLTTLKPGQVRLKFADGHYEIFYVSGGFLEVQPDCVTVLADAADRAQDLDEMAAHEAKKHAEQLLSSKEADIDYAKALAELARAVAQIRAIEMLKRYK